LERHSICLVRSQKRKRRNGRANLGVHRNSDLRER
jgi:hypothetical protein